MGSQIWVEDSALAWLDATVLEINGLEVKAQTKSGKMVSNSLLTEAYMYMFFGFSSVLHFDFLGYYQAA